MLELFETDWGGVFTCPFVLWALQRQENSEEDKKEAGDEADKVEGAACVNQNKNPA